MIACPRCQSSTGVQIADSKEHSREPGAARHSIRWGLHCDECGADWTIVDEIDATGDRSP